MNKQEGAKTRYYVQWDTHARHMCTVLCSLMEHQSLVDLAICCGTNTIHAHKCVLAANSPYFREQLEKNPGTEQVVITGLDFAIVKSIIEFMYCGETNILDENLKYMIAAAKFFQMRGLQTLVSDHQDIRYEADSIHISPPIFLPKKPKYPNAYRPVNNTATPSTFGSFKTAVPNEPYQHRKIKRRYVRTEAEKACAKEAAASRFALEALQKELATTTQVSSFVIEESCTETTVENFIPHSDENFIENLNHMEGVPLQVVNYDDLNSSILTASEMINLDKSECTNNALQFGVRSNPNKDKLKRILGTNLSGNIEIMYRTNEGDFVNVTADVLQNLSGDALQYQIVDENGHIRELRELQALEQNSSSTNYEANQSVPSLESSLTQQCVSDTQPLMSSQNEKYVPCSNLQMLNLSQLTAEDNQSNKAVNEKLQNIDEEVEKITETSQGITENHSSGVIDKAMAENDLIDISSSSCNSSPGKLSSNTTSLNSKTEESDSVTNTLSKLEESTAIQIDENVTLDSSDVNRFLNLGDLVTEEDKCLAYEDNCEISKEHKKRSIFKKSSLGTQKLRNVIADNTNSSSSLSDESNEADSELSQSKKSGKDIKSAAVVNSNIFADIDSTGNTNILVNIDLASDNILNVSLEEAEQNDNEDGAGDGIAVSKKAKLTESSKRSEFASSPVEREGEITDDAQSSEIYSPRKTRSSLKAVEGQSNNDYKEEIGDDQVFHVQYNKPRRIMPNRKKKLN